MKLSSLLLSLLTYLVLHSLSLSIMVLLSHLLYQYIDLRLHLTLLTFPSSAWDTIVIHNDYAYAYYHATLLFLLHTLLVHSTHIPSIYIHTSLLLGSLYLFSWHTLLEDNSSIATSLPVGRTFRFAQGSFQKGSLMAPTFYFSTVTTMYYTTLCILSLLRSYSR